MGFFKMMFFIASPILGFSILAFRLNTQLPIASRWFGSYIGLSYVYFKSILKYIRPKDHVPFEMISIARKTSQQSQALRRELKNTLQKAKHQINSKKNTLFQDFQHQILVQEINQQTDKALMKEEIKQQSSNDSKLLTGSELVKNIMLKREALKNLKQAKRQSNKFIDDL